MIEPRKIFTTKTPNSVFLVSITVALGYFFSHPSPRVRITFANGNAALWLTGGRRDSNLRPPA